MDRAHTNQAQEISVQCEEVTTNKLVDCEANMPDNPTRQDLGRGCVIRTIWVPKNMDRTDRTKRKIGYITKAELLERAKNEFDLEYFPFWLILLGSAPRVCPKCQSQSIKILYLGLPSDRVDGKIWCKWYLWCDSCLYGIYCPPGTYRIPISDPHILWGDEKALKENLPGDLKLIQRARR